MAFGLFKKKENYADRIFCNGHISTLDPELPWAEAVAVRDGRVMVVGSRSEMDDIINDDTEIVDLNGRYMLPGFIDIHHSPVMKMMDEDYRLGAEEDEGESKEELASMLDIYTGFFADEDDEDGEEVEYEIEIVEEEDSEDEESKEDDEEEIELILTDEEGELLDDETEYYIDNSEFTLKVETAMENLSDRGFTTVLDLNTPSDIENEFTDSLVELYTDDKLRVRFFGALYVNRPVPARLAKEVMSMRRNKCVELDDMVRNEFLNVVLDSDSGKPFPQSELNSLLSECADRGFMIYIEAVSHDDLLKAYNAVDFIRSKGYKNNVIIASDEELTDEEDSNLSSSLTVYSTWRSNVMGRGYFDGAITDTEEAIEHLTIVSAEMIGMEEDLGTIERGKYADFAVFSENPYEVKAGELPKLYCDMTVLEGEVVHDVDRENDEYMLNMILYAK